MAINLLDKYGLVPQTLYPETWHTSKPAKLNKLITSKLREYSLELREIYTAHLAVASQDQHTHLDSNLEEASAAGIRACRTRKAAQMAEVYTILAMMYGVPPKPDETLTFEFYDKNKEYKCLKASPKEFYKSIESSFNAAQCISLINDPRNETSKLYTVQRLGNVWGGRPVSYVNTEIEVLEETVVEMLKADVPVW